MTCSGKNAFTGSEIEITFAACIESVAASTRVTGWHIAPAWIDLQVNGFAGVDYNDPSAPQDEIGRSIRTLFSTGVARFYPTVITGAPQAMEAALRNLSCAKEALPEGAAIEGFHVEGPHISPEDGPRGAHPRSWVRKPDLDEFRRWQEATQNRVRIVTLSPEWPGAAAYIEQIVAEGVVASIGHTQATAAQIADAVSAGATLSTHLGNGAHAVLPRFNYIWEQLAEDRLMAGFIVDGIHLPRTFLRAAVRAKGIERSVLVTDAVAPAGCAPGRYRLGELAVELTPDGRVILAGQQRLAGSALRMDRAIGNLIRLAHVSLGDAVRLATVNAAKAGRVSGRQQGLAPGDAADLVQFRFDPQAARVEIGATWLAGREVYRTPITETAPRPRVE
jgi:N-acetylglucosamine-6-phosphate deacetylase